MKTRKAKRERQKRAKKLAKAVKRVQEPITDVTTETFITPVDYRKIYKPRISKSGKVTRYYTESYSGYLFGFRANSAARKLGIPKSLQISDGIWTISRNRWKAAKRLGIEYITEVDPDVMAEAVRANAQDY